MDLAEQQLSLQPAVGYQPASIAAQGVHTPYHHVGLWRGCTPEYIPSRVTHAGMYDWTITSTLLSS